MFGPREIREAIDRRLRDAVCHVIIRHETHTQTSVKTVRPQVRRSAIVQSSHLVSSSEQRVLVTMRVVSYTASEEGSNSVCRARGGPLSPPMLNSRQQKLPTVPTIRITVPGTVGSIYIDDPFVGHLTVIYRGEPLPSYRRTTTYRTDRTAIHVSNRCGRCLRTRQ